MTLRAILVTSHCPPDAPFSPSLPGCLDLLVDRPCIHHVVEQIVNANVKEIDVLIDSRSVQVESELGNGERWGVSIRYHDVTPFTAVYDALPGLPGLANDDDVLLAHADVVVGTESWNSAKTPRPPLEVYYYRNTTDHSPDARWTGWCRGQGRVIAGIGSVKTRQELLISLVTIAGSASDKDCDALSIRDGEQLLLTNARVMSGQAPFVGLRGKRGSNAVWKERGVSVHATATLHEPVYLGEHVEIGAGAVVGPNVVVGAGAIIDAGARARDCLIAKGTYIRPGTTCEHLVGFESRGFWRSSGEPVGATLAGAFVNLQTVSLTPRLNSAVDKCFSLLLMLIFAPVLIPVALALSIRYGSASDLLTESAGHPVNEILGAWTAENMMNHGSQIFE